MSEPLSLLLVEDDEFDRMVVARTLKRAELEAEIREVASLEEAREVLSGEDSFDCVLLDFRLPDGIALELLSSDEETDWVGVPAPVVVLTGHAELALAEKCLQAGAQDYLVKGSFGDDALARAIRYARERWGLSERLKQQAQELRRSNVELEEFAYIVSHDLQEPLRSASRFASRLEDMCGDLLDDKGRTYLERLTAAHSRMSGLIRDLLSLAHVGRVDMGRTKQVSLDSVMQGVLEDLDHRMRDTGASVEASWGPEVVLGVPSLVQQLLTNLVGNALKYHREGEAPKVRLSSRRKRRGWVEISVKDEGIGFSDEHAKLVFMPFKRLRPKDYEGTGIGLPICKKIVELHGGSIAAAGEPGVGSTFTFLLPSPVGSGSSAKGAPTA